MARKIIDSYATVTIKPELHGTSTSAEAARAAADVITLIKTHVLPHQDDVGRYCKRIEVDFTLEHDARCEHCNNTWTEDGPDYNGGCCDKDEEGAPK